MIIFDDLVQRPCDFLNFFLPVLLLYKYAYFAAVASFFALLCFVFIIL